MENPERILRSRNKEKVNSSLFGTSSSQDLHDIPESEWETNVEKVLSKSKLESDLKKVENNPSRLESYLLDALWLDLETSAKAKKAVTFFRTSSFPTPHFLLINLHQWPLLGLLHWLYLQRYMTFL